jgi:hypothetical protein
MRPDAPAQELHGIFAGNPDTRDPMLLQLEQEVAHSVPVNLHAQVIFFRMSLRHLPGGIAITETNLHDNGMAVTKQLLEIKFPGTFGNPKNRPQFFKRAPLTPGQTTRA